MTTSEKLLAQGSVSSGLQVGSGGTRQAMPERANREGFSSGRLEMHAQTRNLLFWGACDEAAWVESSGRVLEVMGQDVLVPAGGDHTTPAHGDVAQ